MSFQIPAQVRACSGGKNTRGFLVRSFVRSFACLFICFVVLFIFFCVLFVAGLCASKYPCSMFVRLFCDICFVYLSVRSFACLFICFVVLFIFVVCCSLQVRVRAITPEACSFVCLFVRLFVYLFCCVVYFLLLCCSLQVCV